MLLPRLLNFWSDATHRKKVGFTLQMYVFIAVLKSSCISEQKQHPTLVTFFCFYSHEGLFTVQ